MTDTPNIRPEVVDLLVSVYMDYEPGEAFQLRHPDGREPGAAEARMLASATEAEIAAMNAWFARVARAREERIQLARQLWQIASTSPLPDDAWTAFLQEQTYIDPGDAITPSQGERLHIQHCETLAAGFRKRIRPHLSDAEQDEADGILRRLTELHDPRLQGPGDEHSE